MHTPFTRTTRRFATLAALTASLLGATGLAQAGQGVYWAVNVDAPIQGAGRVGTTFSNTPRGVHGGPTVVVAPPVVYAPQPVYAPRPVYVQREPEYRRCPPRWLSGVGWGWHHRHHDERRYGWRDDDGRYGDRHGYRDGRRDDRYDGRRQGDRYAWGDND